MTDKLVHEGDGSRVLIQKKEIGWHTGAFLCEEDEETVNHLLLLL